MTVLMRLKYFPFPKTKFNSPVKSYEISKNEISNLDPFEAQSKAEFDFFLKNKQKV